ncbi:MAG: TIGR02217 family protein [Alphaproteobacteria bacterium]|nr:TIGR02217 family protein [Alphaproteobacteria bacterium]
MAFDEVRFPVDIAYGSSGGPEFSTAVVTTAGGHEHRNVNWSNARARYNIAWGVKTQAQLTALTAFFRARYGRARGFRYKDWTDFRGVYEAIGTGDGETTVFYLSKQYTNGSSSEVRAITKPVSGTVKVYLDGVLQTSGFGIDHATGRITFSAAPAEGIGISADFEFDVPVRFDTDHLSARLDDFGAFSWQDIPLIEIR